MIDNNNDCNISDDKTNNYCETVDSKNWIASVNRHNNIEDILATSMINMKNDNDNPNNS